MWCTPAKAISRWWLIIDVFITGSPPFIVVILIEKNKFIRLTIDDFLTPYKQMAQLCQLEWSGYIFSGGLSYASRHDEKELARMKEKSIRHAQLFYSSLRFFRL